MTGETRMKPNYNKKNCLTNCRTLVNSVQKKVPLEVQFNYAESIIRLRHFVTAVIVCIGTKHIATYCRNDKRLAKVVVQNQ